MRTSSPLKTGLAFVLAAKILLVAASAETSTLTCSSDTSTNRTYCPLPVNAVTIYLAEQISVTPCIYGETWGLQDTYVWTAQGCTAEFVAEDSRAPVDTHDADPFGFEEEVFRREA